MIETMLDELRGHFEAVAVTTAEQLTRENPHVVALVAKWRPEDLVPGLSDLDFRVICDDDTTDDDWVEIDHALGHIHLELVRANPQFNRINEHTAGAGMTVGEILDPRFHNPEYAVWHQWHGRRDVVEPLRHEVARRPFGAADEHYHFGKFLCYYSPYIHGIDPPINLGPFEPKYAMHWRCWHYFAPAMLSAASLLARRNLPGKRTALGWLSDHGHIGAQVEDVLRHVDRHFETPESNDPGLLAEFERFLFAAFEEVLAALRRGGVGDLKLDRATGVEQLKQQLRSMSADPLAALMESMRFARIRACRYFFYLNAPAHFEATLQMHAELPWVRKLTHHVHASLCAILGEDAHDFRQCLDRLGVGINAAESDAVTDMFAMADVRSDDPALRAWFARAAEVFPDYYRVLARALSKAADAASRHVVSAATATAT